MHTVFVYTVIQTVSVRNLDTRLLIKPQVKHSFSVKQLVRNNYLCTYDLYSPMHNVLYACIFIQIFWAPNGTRLSAWCHFTGPKKLLNSRAQPPPTSPSNGYACIQNIMQQGCINHRCIGCFIHTNPLVTLTGSITGRFKALTVWGWMSR